MTLRNRTPRRDCSAMDALVLENIRFASKLWGLSAVQKAALKVLTRKFQLSVSLGDLCLLDARWYVTHSGLTGLARRSRCAGINVRSIRAFCDPASSRWVFKATVYKSASSRGFVGHGDADPSNTSVLVRGAEMRVAETRAVNRALRKACGIGICSVEELGSRPFSSFEPKKQADPGGSNGSPNGQPRLRDKLCLLIRKYELDPNLVKRYAADFCGTETLRDASRDLVEAFVSTVAKEAANDRAALICKLNSYCQPEEVRP
jgi:hypothetical protein